jgi:hypothetical protein
MSSLQPVSVLGWDDVRHVPLSGGRCLHRMSTPERGQTPAKQRGARWGDLPSGAAAPRTDDLAYAVRHTPVAFAGVGIRARSSATAQARPAWPAPARLARCAPAPGGATDAGKSRRGDREGGAALGWAPADETRSFGDVSDARRVRARDDAHSRCGRHPLAHGHPASSGRGYRVLEHYGSLRRLASRGPSPQGRDTLGWLTALGGGDAHDALAGGGARLPRLGAQARPARVREACVRQRALTDAPEPSGAAASRDRLAARRGTVGMPTGGGHGSTAGCARTLVLLLERAGPHSPFTGSHRGA